MIDRRKIEKGVVKMLKVNMGLKPGEKLSLESLPAETNASGHASLA